ncbi:MAG: hypothetical protein HW391_1807 [Chloroflexi bacterium]|nr:hypothetical protein [Chloroflexota bacterium]
MWWFQCGMSVPPPSARTTVADNMARTTPRIQEVTNCRELVKRENMSSPF